MVSVINKDTEERHTFDSNCKVAYGGCHKIYICKDEADIKEATKIGYEIHEISDFSERLSLFLYKTISSSKEHRYVNIHSRNQNRNKHFS